jgi:peptide/nickel transport system substrate-binding protein
LGVGAAALTAITLLAGCAAGTADDTEDSTLVLGGTPATATLDVLIGNLWYDRPAAQAVYDALFTWEQDTDTYGPFLASDWSLSDDRMVLHLTLRDDVVFSDGEALTPEAVINVLEPRGDFQSYGSSYEVTGEHSLDVIATRPIDGQLLQNITGIAIYSPAKTTDELAESPAGTGPYLLDEESSTIGVELNFVRNPDYWGDPDDFAYDNLTVKVFDDTVAAVNALKSGQVDATLVDIGSVPDLESSGFAVTTGTATFFTLQFADLEGKVLPPIGDVRVRQAINMAFDRAAINDALAFGYGDWSSQAFIDVQPAYLAGRDDEYPYDPERAKDLLAEAGYPDGFALTIPTISTGYSTTSSIEPIVQQSLAEIGIDVTYEPYVDFGTWAAEAATFPVGLVEFYYINTINFHLKPTGSGNVWKYADPRALELFDVIDTGSVEESRAASQELGELALEEAWLAPFYRPPVAWASIPEVTLSLDPLSAPVRLTLFKPAD